MSRQHGIAEKTYTRLIIDAGQLRINYTDEANPGALLAATRGGSSVAIESDIREMPVDGKKGGVVGDKRISKVTASITANIVEISSWVLALAMPGCTTEDFPALTPTHDQIRRYLAIILGNYKTNITLIGEMSGTDEPMVFIIKNALNTKGISIAIADNDEGVLQMVFTAHFDPALMDAEPWEIRNPWLLEADFDYEVVV